MLCSTVFQFTSNVVSTKLTFFGFSDVDQTSVRIAEPNLLANCLSVCCFSSKQEKVSALENQANQLGLQASQESERLAKDRSLTVQMIQKVRRH